METIEHVRRYCVELKEEERTKKELPNEKGVGLEWMRIVNQRRRTLERNQGEFYYF
jgi:hypothetical protein